MIDGGGRQGGEKGDGDPVSVLDAAAYIHEISGGMAILAEDVGLDAIADTLRDAQRRAGETLARARGQSRKAAPDDAA